MSETGFLEVGAATHVGYVRQLNEDRFISRSDLGLWAVADGMGGHAAGDVASTALIQSLELIKLQHSAAALRQACEASLSAANTAIRQLAKARGVEVMGTTVVALLIFDTHYACLWCGDSRAYLIRDRQISQVTRDHTEVQELIAEGLLSREEASRWPRRNIITRAIGVFEQAEVDGKSGELLPGDVFILCSDGLTGYVAAEELRQSVIDRPAQNACEDLIHLALERGGQDNVTVMVIRYNQRPGPSPNPSAMRPE